MFSSKRNELESVYHVLSSLGMYSLSLEPVLLEHVLMFAVLVLGTKCWPTVCVLRMSTTVRGRKQCRLRQLHLRKKKKCKGCCYTISLSLWQWLWGGTSWCSLATSSMDRWTIIWKHSGDHIHTWERERKMNMSSDKNDLSTPNDRRV